MPFFPLGFWDGVFSEAHMGRLLRVFLATRVGVVFWPLLNMSNFRSCCADQDQVVEGLVLGVRFRRPKARTPLCVKEAKRGV
jgi:hypothetical protein